jgi:hypothetical protein
VIVPLETARLIREGRKTQMRWPADLPCPLKAGHVYAVQSGAQQKAVCRITVAQVPPVKGQLRDMELRDVRAEGYRTTDEFKDFWTRAYGTYDSNREVWIVCFSLGDATHRPRLLTARSGTSLGDYTDIPARAMRGEGESPDESTLKSFTREGREQDTRRAIGAWRNHRKTLQAAIADTRDCLPPGVRDEEVRGMERLLRSLDRKVEQATARVVA